MGPFKYILARRRPPEPHVPSAIPYYFQAFTWHANNNTARM